MAVEPELRLLSPWGAPNSPDSLALELQRELGPQHPLFSKAVRALARATDRDDVLFEISDGTTTKYAVVHLTWTGKVESSSTFPSTEFFASLDDWLDWMKANHEDFTFGEAGDREGTR
jgi:hypothetical protein